MLNCIFPLTTKRTFFPLLKTRIQNELAPELCFTSVVWSIKTWELLYLHRCKLGDTEGSNCASYQRGEWWVSLEMQQSHSSIYVKRLLLRFLTGPGRAWCLDIHYNLNLIFVVCGHRFYGKTVLTT